MSDLLKGIIGLVLWFFLTFGMYKSCNPACDSLPFCGEGAQKAVATPVAVTEVKRFPMDFQWSNATSNTNEGFGAMKANILDGATDNNILEIVGNYYDGEENTTSYEDLGLARAHQIKALLQEELPEARFKLSSNQLGALAEDRADYFESASFNWIAGERGPVEILDDRAIIRFPYNSVQKEVDPKIDAYLEGLANQLKENGGTVQLTGHTDDQGSSSKNETLAHRRAKMIRDILREKGVKRNQIKTATEGESQPISSNETEDGRRDNRRVEVQVDF